MEDDEWTCSVVEKLVQAQRQDGHVRGREQAKADLPGEDRALGKNNRCNVLRAGVSGGPRNFWNPSSSGRKQRLTIKRLEAKQGWIDREVQRLEAESAAAASVQGNLKIRQEKLRAEVEEVRKRRLEIIQENSDTDLNKSDIPTPESIGDVRDLESKELNFRRAVAQNARRT